jgi:hypothetical protein
MPGEIEAEVEAMALGNPDDEVEIQAAQAAYREARREDLWQQRTPEREEILSDIEQHPDYRSITSGAQASTICGILKVSRRLFSDAEIDPYLRIKHVKERLRSVKMTSASGYDAFLQRFNEARRVVVQEGGRVEHAVLIQYFREGLHDIPFSEQKKNHRDRILRRQFADTIEGFMAEMTNAYRDWEKLKVPTDKESAVVLTATESHDEGDSSESDEKESAEVRTKKKTVYELVGRCPMCNKKHRGECTNVEAVRRYYQEKFDRELAEKMAETEKRAAKLRLGKPKHKLGVVKVTRGMRAGSDED